MSDEESNVAVLKEAYDKWRTSKGAPEHFMKLVDPEIRFGSLADGKEPLTFARAYEGQEALSQYFEGLAAEWDMIDYVTDEFVAQGDAVVMRGSCQWANKRTGKIMKTPKLDFWRMRNGKAVEFFEFYDTAAAHVAATE